MKVWLKRKRKFLFCLFVEKVLCVFCVCFFFGRGGGGGGGCGGGGGGGGGVCKGLLACGNRQ